MEKNSDGQHRSEGRAFNDGQKTQMEQGTRVGQESGLDSAKHTRHIGLDADINTTSHAAGGLERPGEKHGGADDQK